MQYFLPPLYFLGDLSAVLHHFYIYSPLLTVTPTDGAAAGVHHSYNSIKNPGANLFPFFSACADTITEKIRSGS